MDVQIDRLDLFPVPLLGADYEHAESLSQTLVPMFQKIEMEDTTPTTYGSNSYANYSSGVIEWVECNSLRNWIGQIALEANKIIVLESDLSFVGSWFGIHRQHATLTQHSHIPCTWSGVYFVQAEEDDAPITFHDVNKQSNWPFANDTDANTYNTHSYSITPKTGRLLIFPSHLQHSVEQQLIQRERIAINFNLSATQGQA